MKKRSYHGSINRMAVADGIKRVQDTCYMASKSGMKWVSLASLQLAYKDR